MVQNTCPCANPPGGEVRCESNQLAICIVRDGQAKGLCLTPGAAALRSQTAMENWVIESVTKSKRSSSQPISARDREILDSGSYSPGPGIVVRFSVPVLRMGEEAGMLVSES